MLLASTDLISAIRDNTVVTHVFLIPRASTVFVFEIDHRKPWNVTFSVELF